MSGGDGRRARRIDPSVTRGATVSLLIDGEIVTAHAGESVAAALLGTGRWTSRRSTRRGEPRGYYCGMGVCHECLVSVDGRPGVRACMVEVADGMRIQTAAGAAT